MRKLAQNPVSLDSDPLVENFVDDFAADGPLFAELFNPDNPIEVDENININIMDSEDEMEQYFGGKKAESSSSEVESVVEVPRSRPQPLKVKFPNITPDKTKVDKVGHHSNTFGTQTGSLYRPPPTIINPASVVTQVEVIEPVIRAPKINKKSPTIVIEKVSPPVVVIEADDNIKEEEQSRDKCMNKNAIMARENRQKKKQYVQNLERTCEKMRMENFALKANMESKDKQMKSMAKEIEYLRSVIANETGLSALLKNIQNTSGLNFITSLGQDKGESSQKHGNKRSGDSFDSVSQGEQVKKKRKTCTSSEANNEKSSTFEGPPTPCASPEPQSSGGVCLHVAYNNVSLEFCSACATSASEVWKVAGDHNYNRVPIKHEPCDDSDDVKCEPSDNIVVDIKPEPRDSPNYVVVRQDVADYVVIKKEVSNSDEES